MTNEELCIRAIKKMSEQRCMFTVDEKRFAYDDIYVTWIDDNGYTYRLVLRKSDANGNRHNVPSEGFFNNLIVEFRYLKVSHEISDKPIIYYSGCFSEDRGENVTSHCQWVIDAYRQSWVAEKQVENVITGDKNEEIARILGI